VFGAESKLKAESYVVLCVAGVCGINARTTNEAPKKIKIVLPISRLS
jgi:hypothetical protein